MRVIVTYSAIRAAREHRAELADASEREAERRIGAAVIAARAGAWRVERSTLRPTEPPFMVATTPLGAFCYREDGRGLDVFTTLGIAHAQRLVDEGSWILEDTAPRRMRRRVAP